MKNNIQISDVFHLLKIGRAYDNIKNMDKNINKSQYKSYIVNRNGFWRILKTYKKVPNIIIYCK